MKREDSLKANALRFRPEKSRLLINLGLFIDELETEVLPLGGDIPESVWRRLVELAHQLPVRPPAEAWRAQTLQRLQLVLIVWRDALSDYLSTQRLMTAAGRD